ncbi:MAG TPA: copper chaperone PCu(A)C [Amaricoccus sp.]|uniref:copper chaperone PCu(A)C n=1 Tax=Amaricoccus sp. TaxID=1872485 RepID=UPI002BB46BF2|nr:copper chaperone PCu(A)C [Amaricoccus sp.]HMQ93969.1 copper chaperone PCu(A)C [Amaricoccus sp.]HMR53698.1 copper chaperone PCu(A)C [Amaricoccus sp.]HMU00704.1 copper chaperone PCu(A)C [Amaricoccus sp.]
MKLFLAAACIATFPAAALAEVVVSDPWARATILASRPGAAYLTLHSDADDRLLSATTPVADHVMIHASETGADSVTRMIHLDALDLEAGQTVRFAPGGMHLMLLGLAGKLDEGASFPLTLTFERAGAIMVDVSVLGVAATGPEGEP